MIVGTSEQRLQLWHALMPRYGLQLRARWLTLMRLFLPCRGPPKASPALKRPPDQYLTCTSTLLIEAHSFHSIDHTLGQQLNSLLNRRNHPVPNIPLHDMSARIYGYRKGQDAG